MNKLTKTFSWGILITLVSGFYSASFAQAQYEQGNGYQSNEKDSIYGDAPGGLNPIDLMHRAQQLNGRSAQEFEAESQGQIENSAADFKRLQQQRILEQQQPPTESTE